VKVFAVEHFFEAGQWSFYPGETFSESALESFGLGPKERERRVSTGHLREHEEQGVPAQPELPSLDEAMSFIDPVAPRSAEEE